MRIQTVSVKKNFSYQVIYEVLAIILPLITSPYVSRKLGPANLGIYSYTYSIANCFVIFSMLGLRNYGNRVIAQVRNSETDLCITFSNLLVLHFFVSLIFSVIYIIFTIFSREHQIYIAIQGLYVISGIFDISWFYFGIEQFKLPVIRSVVIKLITFILIFVFVRDEDDLWKYCTILAGAQLLCQMALWIPLHKYIIHFVKPSWSQMKLHFKPLIILFIPAVAVNMYKFMDKIMLGLMSSDVQLGYYDNAEKAVNIPLTIINAFGTVMLPKMSNLAAVSKRSEVDRYLSVSFQFVMWLAFAMGFGVAAVGNVFSLIFWGSAFRESGRIIMGLSVTIPFFSFANVIRTQYLIPNGRDREYMISVICGAVLNLFSNALLIPLMGAMGAAIGTIIAEVSVCFVQTYYVRRELPLHKYVYSFLFFVPVGLLMFAMVYKIGTVLDTNISTLLIMVSAGVVFYSAVSMIYFVLTKNEIILGILGKIKHKR